MTHPMPQDLRTGPGEAVRRPGPVSAPPPGEVAAPAVLPPAALAGLPLPRVASSA